MNTNASSKFGLYFVLLLLLFEKCRSADSTLFLWRKFMAELMEEKHSFNLGNISNFETEMRIVMKELMNSTLPVLVDIVNAASVSNDCTKSLIKYAFDLINVRSWAMRMLDATSKLPSGILEGTLSELGAFDQCLDIELPYKNGSFQFQGQYCGLEINRILPHLPANFNVGIKGTKKPMSSIGDYVKKMGSIFFYTEFRFGVCVPSKCSLTDMQRIAGQVAKKIQMEVSIKECYKKDPIVFETIHIAVLSVLSVLLAISIGGSCLEYQLNKDSFPQEEQSNTKKIFLCFSLISNYKHLIASSEKSDKLKVLQGIKALTIAWVMFGHNYAWTNFPLARKPKLLTDAYQKLEFGLVLNSWLSVEPFFLINGLFASYAALKIVPVFKRKLFVPLYTIRRYLRILMLLLLTVGLGFFMPVVSSGPFWYDVVDQELENCRQNWWISVLFLSNWISMKKICISTASWFISTDIQLHVISIIPIFILYKSRKFGVFFIVCLIFACNMAIAVVTFQRNLLPFVQMSCADKQKIQDTIDYVHLRPYTHAGPFFVGVILGVIILHIKSIKLTKMQNVLGWTGSILLALTALYGAHDWNIGNPHGPLLTSVFASMHRTTFAMSVAWVVFVCVTRNGGPVDMLLSSTMLAPAGKLTFMIFMLHSLIFWVRKATVRERLYVSHYNLLYDYIGNIVFTIMISIPCYLLVEAPIVNLDSLLFSEKKKEDPENQEKKEHLPGNIVIHNYPHNTPAATGSIAKPCSSGTQNIFIGCLETEANNANYYKTVIHIKSNYKNR
ncbi:nose resistant to fluoxetine protein 6 [Trichonephila clavata]|uniref:Nose resistant to fluoxetine protein 6 n=1 Tax=Trichonephila clavata TaxID=2740835 RepID=A0A8X6KPX6_TRICU|nr:nose resistant to fluoxetine protein 6 [Trichonephila clavata]